MKLQYASDLHLEFSQNRDFLKANPLQSNGDILLLAGDIVPFAVMHKHADFFSYVSDHFHTTYWIPGNHEYYNADISKRSGTLHEKIKENVILVNNNSLIHENVKIILTTLWSHISRENHWYIQKGMNDFQVIKFNSEPFSSDHFNQMHEECLDFLQQELKTVTPTKTVVVTHHVPTFMNYPEKYKADILNQAFAVELFDLISESGPNYWIYGHTHHNTPDFKIGRTHLLSNQLGYVKYNEHTFFDGSKNFVI